jgi:hypothetical protein
LYAILGEAPSDVATLRVIVRRLANDDKLRVAIKGYSGCGELLRKGATQLRLFAGLQCTRFIICHDADGPDPGAAFRKVEAAIAKPSGVSPYCIVVPVHELEAWLLADIEAVCNLISSWKPDPISNPEAIPDPKEYIEKLSRNSNRRPRYSHPTHNERLAQYIDLGMVLKKCPSFNSLHEFVVRN